MSKRIGVTLIVVALVICVAYGIIGLTTFEECPVETTTPTDVKTYECKAEIVYNSLAYSSGEYEYSIQASVNVEKLTKKSTVTESMAITQQSKDAISAIKQEWENKGYTIKKSEDYFVSATIAYYKNYESLALANGQTGYDSVASDALVYRGWLFTKTVSERTTVFKQEEGSVLNRAEEILNGIDGVSEGDVSLVFNYGSPYKVNTISSDADQIYKLNDAEKFAFSIVHEFRMNDGNRGRVITLVQQNPNVYTWYLIPIVCALLIAGCAVLVSSAKRSK